MKASLVSRRALLGGFPALVTAQAARPAIHAVASGDPLESGAVIWSCTDRRARMVVEYATRPDFEGARQASSAMATAAAGYTARVELTDLAPDAEYFYRVRFESAGAWSEPVAGRVRTAPRSRRTVRLLWSGDTCGQGYGINPDLGGMRIYETMRALDADLFVHSGDTIYADNPIPREMTLKDGTVWRNVVTEAKSRVAQTLEDFRGCYRYNLLDANLRRFQAETPQVWQWDDHEFRNNWSPGDAPGSAAARQAFTEFAPMRLRPGTHPLIHRRIPYGPLAEIFLLDMRSYRGPNTHNRQEKESAETRFLGAHQMDWLIRGLTASPARWKIIAADMPVGLLVADGKDGQGRPRWEAVANGGGPPLGRELEIAQLLKAVRKAEVRNTVWVTADVHYTAAHHYSPDRAKFTDFLPFWEFVSGPLNAGTFGPGQLDGTFGPEAIFTKAPPPGESNLPPSAGYQFFGEIEIDGRTEALTVRLRDASGAALFTKTLEPAAK
jgi:alkaline phosphatase D